MNCEFCDKELNDKDEHMGISPEGKPIVYDNPICKLQLTIKLLELKRDELHKDIKANESQIKQLNNIHRLMGITPIGIEMMIRTMGIDVPGIKIALNAEWSWDKISVDNAVTLGLHFLQGIERSAREWSEFIHAKGVKLQINKSQLESSTKLKQVKKVRDKTEVKPNGLPKVKLSKFERMVMERCKTFKSMTQDQAIESFKLMGMPIEQCRDLKELGVI